MRVAVPADQHYAVAPLDDRIRGRAGDARVIGPVDGDDEKAAFATPFDFGEKAYLAPYDPPLDGFLDQWLHLIKENGTFATIYAKWF